MHAPDNRTVLTLAAAAAVGLAGCGGSGSSDSTGASDGQTGFFSLGVSDAPVHDAEKVCITFDSLEFKPAGEDEPSFVVELDPPEKINLLDFQGANAAPLLFEEELPAGDYEWLRLGVDASRGGNGGADDTGDAMLCDGAASYIVLSSGAVNNLFVPSGDQTGLKLVRGFTVPVNGSANFTAEWDLMRSIVAPPGLAPDVILKPTIKLVNNADVGTLTGAVAGDLATAEGCEPSVFVFDDGVTPNPDDPEVDDPEDAVATGMVKSQMNDDGSTTYTYSIGFLAAGDYEAAFTCDGQVFEPEDGKAAPIVAGGVTTVDFP